MGYLLAIIRSLSSPFTTIISKNYMSGTNGIKSNFDIRVLLVYPIATIFYLIMADFNVPLNFITFVFAIVYALVALGSDWCSMFGYNHATVLYLAVFSAAGATICSFLYELFFTDDVFSVCMILSIVARILSITIPLFFAKNERYMTFKGFLFCIFYFILSGVSPVISRIYVDTPNVVSTASFCFWVNILIMPTAFLKIFLSALRSKESGFRRLLSDAKLIKPKYYIWVAISIVTSNLMFLVNFEVVRLIGSTASSIISGSLGMIFSVLISVFIYKEGASKASLVSAVMSVVAVILSVF